MIDQSYLDRDVIYRCGNWMIRHSRKVGLVVQNKKDVGSRKLDYADDLPDAFRILRKHLLEDNALNPEDDTCFKKFFDAYEQGEKNLLSAVSEVDYNSLLHYRVYIMRKKHH